MAATEIRPAIIRLGPKDIDAGLALSNEAAWNQTPADWDYFLTQGIVFGARDSQGRVIATAALLPYQRVAWISLVLVTAAWRRRGLARALLARCLEAAEAGELEAWLDATPAGAAVYEKIGFISASNLERLSRPATNPGAAIQARAVDDQAFQHLLDCDRRAMGFDRTHLLREFAERPGTKLYWRGGAACLVRDGRRARHIGPLFAETGVQARGLINDVTRTETGALIIDLFDRGSAVLTCLLERGFTSERPFLRMRRAPPRQDAESALLAASAGPEYG